MIVYKVVSKTDKPGKFKSCLIHNPHLCLDYETGKTTRPMIGCILAFAFINQAQGFARGVISSKDSIILKCKARVSERAIVSEHMINFNYLNGLTGHDLALEGWMYTKRNGDLANLWPTGTVYCNELTPLEIVEI
jgi:hypothetical protein